MAKRLVVVGVAAIAAGGLTLPACKDEAKGQLIVAVTTDMKPGDDFNRVEVEITAGTDRRTERFNDVGGTLKFPFTIAIVEGSTPGTEVQVRVVTGLASPGSQTFLGEPRTLHDIAAVVPSDRIALARIHVDWLCVDSADVLGGSVASRCKVGQQTCVGGTCLDFVRQGAALPTFDERAVFGWRTAGEGDGTCFDTVRCFAAGAMTDVELETCTLARPAGDAVNVALVLPPGERMGICGTEACYLPLDIDARHGVRVAGTRLQLPFEACRRLAGTSTTSQRRLLGVAVTSACAAKTVETPTCGPWSSARGGAFTEQAPSPRGYRDADVRDAMDAADSGDAGD